MFSWVISGSGVGQIDKSDIVNTTSLSSQLKRRVPISVTSEQVVYDVTNLSLQINGCRSVSLAYVPYRCRDMRAIT